MPEMGKRYSSGHDIKVPAKPTAGSSGKVTSGKVTASSYGPQKVVGKITLSKRETT